MAEIVQGEAEAGSDAIHSAKYSCNRSGNERPRRADERWNYFPMYSKTFTTRETPLVVRATSTAASASSGVTSPMR